MKYNIENFKGGKKLGIGPINPKQRDEIFSILHREGFKWNGGQSLEGKEVSYHRPYILLNSFAQRRITHGFEPIWEDVISYETFMEHNKPVYRIKTREELLQVPNVQVQADGSITVPHTNTVINEMFSSLGKEISKESFDLIMASDFSGTFIPEAPFNWPKWTVTDKPLHVEQKKIIAYKLKKEYPGRKVGDMAKYQPEICQSNFFWQSDEKTIPTEFQPDVNPEWWEPVYEEEKTVVEVKIGNPSKTIKIFKESKQYKIEGFGDSFSLPDLRNLLTQFEVRKTCEIGAKWGYTVESIWIGCKESGTSITKEDIITIFDVYKDTFKSEI